MNLHRLSLLASLALAAPLLSMPQPGRAAESYHTCAGFIDSLPTVISSQGVWCLRQDLSTSIAAGNAISINTNNVTIDCNNFKIGGLAAGNGSQTIGVYASNRLNATVRHCNIRGFRYGIRMPSGSGHLIEDNRLDNNLYAGIYASGDNHVVQRNRIYDTGGATGSSHVYGIDAQADIIDNTVSGLFVDQPEGLLHGIRTGGKDSARVSGNNVSGFDMVASVGGAVVGARGIFTAGQHTRISGNQIAGGDQMAISGTGIFVNGGAYSSAYCLDNTVGGFEANLLQCDVSNGNLTLP